jgi:hypothetical protein
MQKELKQLEQAYDIEWKKYLISDLFSIESTLSFNKDSLTEGHDYDYVTRTSQNQGILQPTGFVNSENINLAGTWSLGLLQMDFFYRERPWYAGQFVRKIVPKFTPSKKASTYFTVLLNKLKHKLLTVLVRDVDKTFLNMSLLLPVKDSQICFDYMEAFINKIIEIEHFIKVEDYLTENNIKDTNLTISEKKALDTFLNQKLGKFKLKELFNNIVQGRRLKKEDHISGSLPFVMSGITNTGVVNYIGNDVNIFPSNSITVDIFGNVFYRNFEYGLGDDTGAYWNTNIDIDKKAMLYISTAMQSFLQGKFDYGNKLRSSQSLNFEIILPIKDDQPDYEFMGNYISAIQKLTVKKLISYLDEKKSKLDS